MADYTFFFNPMSRAQIARWALHEAGADISARSWHTAAASLTPWSCPPWGWTIVGSLPIGLTSSSAAGLSSQATNTGA